MYFVKSLAIFVAVASMVSAMPGMDRHMVTEGIFIRDTARECNNHTGDCYATDCKPTFHKPTDTTGYCTSGEFNKCPCSKCGNEGDLLCNDDACDGVDDNGRCSTKMYKGCPCLMLVVINVGEK